MSITFTTTYENLTSQVDWAFIIKKGEEELKKNTPTVLEQAKIHHILARCHYRLGNYAATEQSALNAQKCTESLETLNTQAVDIQTKSFYLVSAAYRAKAQADKQDIDAHAASKAREWMDKALALLNGDVKPSFVIQAKTHFNEAALAFDVEKKYENAAEHIIKAQKIYKEQGLLNEYNRATIRYGHILLAQDKIEEAQIQAKNIKTQTIKPHSRLSIHFKMFEAEIAVRNNQKDHATLLLTQAKTAAERLNMAHDIIRINEQIHSL